MSIYEEIQEERDRQDQKWGERNHHPAKWLIILGEEYGEACKHCLEAEQDNDVYYSQYRKELIQVAAVAVAAIESLDRNNV